MMPSCCRHRPKAHARLGDDQAGERCARSYYAAWPRSRASRGRPGSPRCSERPRAGVRPSASGDASLPLRQSRSLRATATPPATPSPLRGHRSDIARCGRGALAAAVSRRSCSTREKGPRAAAGSMKALQPSTLPAMRDAVNDAGGEPDGRPAAGRSRCRLSASQVRTPDTAITHCAFRWRWKPVSIPARDHLQAHRQDIAGDAVSTSTLLSLPFHVGALTFSGRKVAGFAKRMAEFRIVVNRQLGITTVR